MRIGDNMRFQSGMEQHATCMICSKPVTFNSKGLASHCDITYKLISNIAPGISTIEVDVDDEIVEDELIAEIIQPSTDPVSEEKDSEDE